MRCLPTSPDWGVITMCGLLTFGFGLVAGKLWGEKTGPARNWMEPTEPPDPPE